MFGTIHYNPPSRFIGEIPTPLRKVRKVCYGRSLREAMENDDFAQCSGVDDYDGIRQVKVEYHPSSSSFHHSASRSALRYSFSSSKSSSSLAPSPSLTSLSTRQTSKKGLSGRGQKYWVGAKVEHKLLGRGTIVAVEGQGEKEKVIIRFKNGDLKRFMAALAPLSPPK